MRTTLAPVLVALLALTVAVPAIALPWIDARAASVGADVDVFSNGYRDADSDTIVTVISSGTSVRWTWTSGVHSVTHVAHPTADALVGAFDSGIVATAPPTEPATVFEHTFDTPGVYPYYCRLHALMRGVVVVTA